MSKFSISSAIAIACVCGAVASAGVIGTYAVIAPIVAAPIVAAQTPATSQVRLSIDGHLPVRLRKDDNGVLVPATAGTVTFVQSGDVIQQAPMGIDGTVQVEGLHVGPYSVFVRGADGFAAFGTWLNPAATEEGDPGSIIDVGLVPDGDMPVVQQIITDHLRDPSPYVSQLSELAEPDLEIAHPPTPNPVVYRDLPLGYGFEIDAEGVVHGRIVRTAPPTEPVVPLARLSVYFIRSGEIVAQAQTDADGRFDVSGLTPGAVSLAVAGTDAFLALAADVHQADSDDAAILPYTELPFDAPPPLEGVSVVNGETACAQGCPVFPADLPYLLGEDPVEGVAGAIPGSSPVAGVPPCCGEPPCCGSGGGGFGGGGGFAGGGGGGGLFGGSGLGALLGLAALGAAAAIIASDDDNQRRQVRIVSPAFP